MKEYNPKILLILSTSVFWSLTNFVGVDFLYEVVSFRQAGAAPALRRGDSEDLLPTYREFQAEQGELGI